MLCLDITVLKFDVNILCIIVLDLGDNIVWICTICVNFNIARNYLLFSCRCSVSHINIARKMPYLDINFLNLDITILNLGVSNLNLGFSVLDVCVTNLFLAISIFCSDVNVSQYLFIIVSLVFCISHKFHAHISLYTTLFVHYV